MTTDIVQMKMAETRKRPAASEQFGNRAELFGGQDTGSNQPPDSR